MLHNIENGPLEHAPGPTYMSNKQMEHYLQDLRVNRPPRPMGSRPLPLSQVKKTVNSSSPHLIPLSRRSISSNDREPDAAVSRSASAFTSGASRAMNYSLSGRSSPEKMTHQSYKSREEKEKEKEDVHKIRLALEEMDLKDEQRVYAAAQGEAVELMRKHQNSDAPYRVQGKKDEVLPFEKFGLSSETGNSTVAQRDDSGFSHNSSRKLATGSSNQISTTMAHEGKYEVSQIRPTIACSDNQELSQGMSPNEDTILNKEGITAKLRRKFSVNSLTTGRRVSGTKRNVSGQKPAFPNAVEKIYEDPPAKLNDAEHRTKASEVPAYVRRNPFARAYSTRQSLSGLKYGSLRKSPLEHPAEARTNSPSVPYVHGRVSNDLSAKTQAESSSLMAEPDSLAEPKLLNGVEVRSEEIRAATSPKRKDRSPKLPSPTAVSDSPGRPIVSFKPDWKPPRQETNESPIRRRLGLEPVKSASAPVVPTINHPDSLPIRLNNAGLPSLQHSMAGDFNQRLTNAADFEGQTSHSQQVPLITIGNGPACTSADIPGTRLPGIPSIVVDELDSTSNTTHTVPKLRGTADNIRPLPVISVPRPVARHAATTPVVPSSRFTVSVRRATALCTHCGLSISGRIVSAAAARFHPECFRCHRCGEGLECVAFYPEPTEKRVARLQRIPQRIDGQVRGETDDATQQHDSDESLRFYCHLDFHELFSPRCKSCKTPIEGEVIIACGAEWHVGHFFCAQCGDPFDPKTPFVEKDGYAWCINCHTNRFSPRCMKCRRPVVDMVVKALGAEWHGECFCCTECNGKFEDGRYFLRQASQDPVCMACEEKRLKA